MEPHFATGFALAKKGYTIYRYCVKLIFWYFPSQEVVSAEGTYLGYVYDPISPSDVMIADVVTISKAGRNRIDGKPIFEHYRQNNYSMSMSSNFNHRSVFYGGWRHMDETAFFGSCMFRVERSDGGYRLVGRFLGPDKESLKILGEKWILQKISNDKFSYNSFINRQKRFYSRKLGKLDGLVVKKDLLDQIILKHQTYFGGSKREPFRHGRLKFRIPEGGFHPGFGKISQKMIERIAETNNADGKTVLDVGTGCGFYAIYLASKFNCKEIIGTDSSHDAIETCKVNIEENKPIIKSKNVVFKKTDPDEIYGGMGLRKKFDIIVANMPFSNYQSCCKHEGKEFYANFAGGESYLFDLIMGAKMHLAADGVFYMSFGKSGYKKALHAYEESAGFQRDLLLSYSDKDDEYYVYAYRHKSKVI